MGRVTRAKATQTPPHTVIRGALKLLLLAQGAEGVLFLPDDAMQNDPGQHRGDVRLLGLLLHSHAAVNDLGEGTATSRQGQLPRPRMSPRGRTGCSVRDTAQWHPIRSSEGHRARRQSHARLQRSQL